MHYTNAEHMDSLAELEELKLDNLPIDSKLTTQG